MPDKANQLCGRQPPSAVKTTLMDDFGHATSDNSLSTNAVSFGILVLAIVGGAYKLTLPHQFGALELARRKEGGLRLREASALTLAYYLFWPPSCGHDNQRTQERARWRKGLDGAD